MPELVPCTRCGDFVAKESTLLSDSGEPICNGCNDKADVDVAEVRAANAIFAASGSALGLGLMGMLFNPYLLLTVLGSLSAVGTFGLVIRHPEYRARMGWKLPVTLVVAALGLGLSLLAPVLRAVMLML